METVVPGTNRPPLAVEDVARSAPRMRVAGSLIADIAFDSLLDDPGEAGTVRRLRFVGRTLRIHAVVRPSGADFELTVETTPHALGTIRPVRGGQRATLLRTRPTKLLVEPGLMSLVIEPDDDEMPPVQTAWLVL